MTIPWLVHYVSLLPVALQVPIYAVLIFHALPLVAVTFFAKGDWIRLVKDRPSKGLIVVPLFLFFCFHMFVSPFPPLSLFARAISAWLVSMENPLSWALERYSAALFLWMAWQAVVLYRDPRVLSKDMLDMSGKVVIVTGGSLGGIGYEAAVRLAGKGATVILTTRSETSGIAARDAITAALKAEDPKGRKPGKAVWKPLDLCSLSSVREFARWFQDKHSRLDVLICNAGFAIDSGVSQTADGFEPAVGAMHLGHFLLVRLLLPTLSRAHGRLVVTSSVGHYAAGREDLDDFTPSGPVKANTMNAYRRAKLCNVLMAAEAQRRFGDKISAYSLHPGGVATNIWSGTVVPYKPLNDHIKRLFGFYARILMRSPRRGASDILFAAATRNAEKMAGSYFTDCVPTPPNPLAGDAELCKQLWDRSDEAVKEFLPIDRSGGGNRRRKGR